MNWQFRPCVAEDAEAAVPLIYSSGPAAFDYGFAHGGLTAEEFLTRTFRDGRGLFGYRNHCAVVKDGRLVAVGAFYSGAEAGAMSRAVAFQILRHYPPRLVPRVLSHALRLDRLLPPPSRRTHYAAHLGVAPEYRGQGIGEALLTYQRELAVEQGRRIYALDVAATNPRAQRLYERFGFRVVAERRFNGPVPDARRMEMPLS